MFPAFRRKDVQNWNKFMFYPGALTLMPLRAIISLGGFTLCSILLQPVMFGLDPKKPLTGRREKIRKFMLKFFMRLIVLAAFMSLEVEVIDYDYSHYFGKDYKKT